LVPAIELSALEYVKDIFGGDSLIHYVDDDVTFELTCKLKYRGLRQRS
jgi:hypothetical protein